MYLFLGSKWVVVGIGDRFVCPPEVVIEDYDEGVEFVCVVRVGEEMVFKGEWVFEGWEVKLCEDICYLCCDSAIG